MMGIIHPVKGCLEWVVRASRAEKAKSRERIVHEAARLARERGLRGAGVAEVMAAAGMTHGGFYKHFDSKEALVAAALEAAFADVAKRFAGSGETPGACITQEGFKDIYLSDEHLQNPSVGCPLPALGSEIGRAGPDLKAVFGAGVRRMAEMIGGKNGERKGEDLRRLAMMAGAVMIARASDPQTAADVIDACRRA